MFVAVVEVEIMIQTQLEAHHMVVVPVGVSDLRLLQRLMEIQDPEAVVVVALSMDQVVLVAVEQLD